MARHQRDLRRERTRRRHIERQRSSGQTIRMYCEFHRLRETSFYFWRQEIAKRDRESATRATAATPAPAFVPIAVIESPTDSRTESPIEIRLAEGHRVRVRSGCDRGLLADVLALLRRSASEDRPC
jgi:transposase